MRRMFLCVFFLIAMACTAPPPPSITPPQSKISVEWTSENRSEWLHKNCETKRTTTVTGADDRWRDYNARCAAEKANANVASIIYDDFGTWNIMMFQCKCKDCGPTASDSGKKK